MKSKLTFILVIFGLSLIVVGAQATVVFTPETSIPGSQFNANSGVAVAGDTGTLCDYVIAYYKYGIGIIAIVAMLAVAIGGLQWLLGKPKPGQDWIKSGLSGLGLALVSFLILATINRDLVVCQKITLPDITKVPLNTQGSVTPGCGFFDNCPAGYTRRLDASSCGDKNNTSQVCCCADRQALVDPNFCQQKNDGATCRTANGWGYCENNVCRDCKQKSTHDNSSKSTPIDWPEAQRCYHNSADWECPDSSGVCGNLSHGDCNGKVLGDSLYPVVLASVSTCWAFNTMPSENGIGPAIKYIICTCQ